MVPLLGKGMARFENREHLIHSCGPCRVPAAFTPADDHDLRNHPTGPSGQSVPQVVEDRAVISAWVRHAARDGLPGGSAAEHGVEHVLGDDRGRPPSLPLRAAVSSSSRGDSRMFSRSVSAGDEPARHRLPIRDRHGQEEGAASVTRDRHAHAPRTRRADARPTWTASPRNSTTAPAKSAPAGLLRAEEGAAAGEVSRSWQGFFLATGVQKGHGFVLEAVCGQ